MKTYDVTETLRDVAATSCALMKTSPRLPDTSVAETSQWCEC